MFVCIPPLVYFSTVNSASLSLSRHLSRFLSAHLHSLQILKSVTVAALNPNPMSSSLCMKYNGGILHLCFLKELVKSGSGVDDLMPNEFLKQSI